VTSNIRSKNFEKVSREELLAAIKTNEEVKAGLKAVKEQVTDAEETFV
jgi:hypothetical protein